MSIPAEVIEDILSRLPVKSLLRFRCVCPRWRDLIDSSNFMKLHLSKTIQSDSHLHAIIGSDRRPHAAKLEPSSLSLETKELDHHPLRDEEELIIQVWGSCNGLVCLSNAFNTTALWNPSIREYLKLPSCSFRFGTDKHANIPNYQCRIRYGFGFDQSNDDYKVLRILDLAEKMSGMVVKYDVRVYSVKSNSWREARKNFNELPFINGEPGHLAGGALHWVMGGLQSSSEGCLRIIVAFDLSSEEWGTVPIPRLEDFHCSLSLGCFRDSLCLLSNYPMGYMDIWVMRECGLESSWTKLFSFRPENTRPVYFPKSCGEVLMQHQNGLIWFDVKNCKSSYEAVHDHRHAKNIEVRGMNNFMRVSVFVESLVRLSGFRKVKEEEKKPKEKKKTEM